MEIRVTIFKNAIQPKDGKLLLIKRYETTWDEFLNKCSNKLSVVAKRVYNEDGGEIDEIEVIRDADKLYISQGEQFFSESMLKTNSGIFQMDKEIKSFRIAIMGPAAVGKSAISLRYTRKFFNPEYAPSIEDEYKKTQMFGDEHCEMDILDTAGMEEFVVMRNAWIKDREGFILVYSIDDKQSFQNLKSFYDQIKLHHQNREIPIAVAGNKVDNEYMREVSTEEGKGFARECDDAGFFETSAKKDTGINEVFEYMARQLLIVKYHKPSTSSLSITKSSMDKGHGKGICHNVCTLCTIF